MYTIGFVIEQVLGHITHTQNLRANVCDDPDVRTEWVLVPYEVTGLARHLPVYATNWTVRAGLGARRGLAQMVREVRPDVLFFHTQVPAMLAVDWLRRFPSIISLDATSLQYDRLGEFYDHQTGSLTSELLKWRLSRVCFDLARHIVVWSDWAKQGLIDEYVVPAEKITVIPPGVNVREWLRPTPLKPDGHQLKILFVGGNLERKGGLLLLEAFRSLRHHGIELHLVTRDPVAPEPGVFVYHDMQPNSDRLKALYHCCDIFALPTYGDCLPMVLSEAGAAGMATVSTRVGAIPEVVRHDETGLLVEPGDGAGLTLALQQLVLNPALRLRLAHAAVAHIRQAYDLQVNSRRLLELLKHEAAAARRQVRVA
ncbi:glycosyltransferase family 4 protein [Candidatus Chloroploca asiatica]|uniref:glycosyltransferase family 4 protein n=1 Tax=Candidatus Chloroploca asiatica TaxID=1506545 RepID=UPI001FE862F8|nr:glycosyltransferase family 4 protein [Candidatus Chloroploca asiatica]